LGGKIRPRWSGTEFGLQMEVVVPACAQHTDGTE
jgi:hypothetical protein